MNKKLLSVAGLIVVVLAFVAINVATSRALTGARLDLTEGRLYTLSEGAKNIARKLAEPIRLTLYYSEKTGNEAPAIKAYAARVRELLAEVAKSSNGKVKLEVVNPEAYSDAEDKAVAAGLASFPVGQGGERLYFGLVAVNSTDRQETIPFFDPGREAFLEYDVTRTINLLSESAKKKVGVLTWLPLDGKDPMAMLNRRPSPPWQVYAQLKEFFDVVDIAKDAATIPEDLKVLVVVHPKQVAPKTQYAIDQFVMRGGRVVLFVDPLCEADVIPGLDAMQQMQLPRSSELSTVMASWGVEMVPGMVAADRRHALKVTVGTQARPEPVDYVAWLALTKDAKNNDDPVTGQLETVNVASAGVLRATPGATTTLTPLLMTSTDSMQLVADSLKFQPDPKALLADFKGTGQAITLAARIAGPAKTAFPDGPPKGPDGSADPAQPADKQLKESAQPINVIVFADADLLHDRLWVQEERLFGQIPVGFRKLADNGDLVMGSVDHLSGSSDLMSLRARGKFSRPFVRVEQLQKDAEQKYLAKERELQKDLSDAERKIADLQQKRGTDGQNSLILSPEQQAEVEKITKQMVETRKQLREVRHQLRKDIEGLGSRLRMINVAGMPVLVGLGALGLAAYRGARRRADRASAGARN